MAAKNRDDKAESPAVSTAAGRSWPARHPLLFTFLLSAVIVWAVGTVAYIYFYPRLIYNDVFEKAIVDKGFGEGPIPVNTLYTEPQTLFAEPLASQSASSSNLMTTGVNRDTLLTAGWLDLSTWPGWKGQVPSGMTQISSPNNSVLVIGRVLVYSDNDLPAAYNLAEQIQLTPLNQ